MSIVGGAFLVVVGLLLAIGGAALAAEIPDFPAAAGGALAVIGGIVLVWGALIITMAIFVLRRANWARWVIIIMGGLSVLLSLFGAISGEPSSLVSVVYVGVAAGLLLAPQARQWFSAPAGGGQFNPGNYTR